MSKLENRDHGPGSVRPPHNPSQVNRNRARLLIVRRGSRGTEKTEERRLKAQDGRLKTRR